MSSSTWTSLHISLSLNLGAGLSNQGVAIVSEFISSARVMRGALIVNPWKVEEVSEHLTVSGLRRILFFLNHAVICIHAIYPLI